MGPNCRKTHFHERINNARRIILRGGKTALRVNFARVKTLHGDTFARLSVKMLIIECKVGVGVRVIVKITNKKQL